jgi:hypothetical protein
MLTQFEPVIILHGRHPRLNALNAVFGDWTHDVPTCSSISKNNQTFAEQNGNKNLNTPSQSL